MSAVPFVVRLSLRFFRRRAAVANGYRKKIIDQIQVIQAYVDGNNREVKQLEDATAEGHKHLSQWAQQALRDINLQTRKILAVETVNFLYDIHRAREALRRRQAEAGAARSIISRVQRRFWLQKTVTVAEDLDVCRVIEGFL